MESIKDKLPFNVMSTDPSLRVFVEIASLLPVVSFKNAKFPAAILVKDTGEVFIGFDLDWMKKFSIAEQMFIIAHEVVHILLAHMGRSGHKYERLWNIATDAKINDLLLSDYGYTLRPPTVDGKIIGVFLNDLKDKGLVPKDLINANLRAEDIYEYLLKSGAQHKLKLGDPIANEGFDQHDSSLNEQTMGSKLNRQMQRVVKHYEQSAKAGTITGNLIKYLTSSFSKQLSLDSILNRAIYKTELNFNREHRRLRLPGIYIPRYSKLDYQTYVGIDVSQSCYDYQERFISYAYGLETFNELVFCDTEIKQIVTAKDRRPMALEGFGGTDLSPIFERWARIERESLYDSNYIMLTDGELSRPIVVGPKASPVIILTTGKDVCTGWANVINIHIGG